MLFRPNRQVFSHCISYSIMHNLPLFQICTLIFQCPYYVYFAFPLGFRFFHFASIRNTRTSPHVIHYLWPTYVHILHTLLVGSPFRFDAFPRLVTLFQNNENRLSSLNNIYFTSNTASIKALRYLNENSPQKTVK